MRYRVLILGLVVLLLFATTSGNDFIGLDDPHYVPENPHIAAGLTLDGLTWAVTSIGYIYWQPITWISHMIDISVYGMKPGGHHVTNAILHALNAMLLALALTRLTGMAGRSFAVAALFALHPLRVESVAWIAERKDLLAGLFVLLGLLAYERYVRKPSPKALALVGGAYFLALASKPTAITFPFALLLLDFWPLNRIRPIWPVIREKLPLFVLTVASAVVTFIGQRISGAVVTGEVVPLQERLLNIPVSYAKYLLKFLWPHPLVVYYPMSDLVPRWEVAAAIGALLLITAVLFWKRDRPYLITGWLWFLGVLVPMIGVVQVGLQAYADRFTYLASIGLTFAVAWLCAELLPLARAQQLAAVVLVLLTIVTWLQLAYWKDSVTLFSQALVYEPRNPLLQSNLAKALIDRNRAADAVPLLESAVQLQPRLIDAWTNLGVAYSFGHRTDDAIRVLQEAVRRAPNESRPHFFLATALMEKGKPDEALQHYEESLKYPMTSVDIAKTHSDIGLILVNKQKTDEAIAHFRTALDYQPSLIAARRNLAGALIEKNQPEEALRQIEFAIKLAPRDPELRRIREAILAGAR